ncbi:HET-domain-containing protein [Xylariaceae sp. FL1019]|nr:HET-domain-containing protein [Xylariaceae sp. FL1019]
MLLGGGGHLASFGAMSLHEDMEGASSTRPQYERGNDAGMNVGPLDSTTRSSFTTAESPPDLPILCSTMWLINVKTLEMRDFVGEAPPYAILSHTWDEEEVTFKEMLKGRGREKKGYRKIQLTCDQAADDDLGWAWVDTCCIDKRSSAELSEAINSMFRWYEQSTVCYAYISDKTLPTDATRDCFEALLRRCRWATRGWTLQELLAPRNMVFYDSEWDVIGDKFSLARELEWTTGIDAGFIDTTLPLSAATVAEKMAWASQRRTTRAEDESYCLLGIFGVNMPLLYGEGGEGAFERLQVEILRKAYDATIFGFDIGHPDSVKMEGGARHRRHLGNSLATEPFSFLEGDSIECNPDWPELTATNPVVQNKLLQVTVPVIKLHGSKYVAKNQRIPPDSEDVILALFGFRLKGEGPHTLGIVLYPWARDSYTRSDDKSFLAIRLTTPSAEYLESHTKTIKIQSLPTEHVPTTSIQLDRKLLRRVPGFELETLVTVPPARYDIETRWIHHLSQRPGAILALKYLSPTGQRFGLIFRKDKRGLISVQPLNLGQEKIRALTRTLRDDVDDLEVAQVAEYRLLKYFDPYQSPDEEDYDDNTDEFICPVTMGLGRGSLMTVDFRIISTEKCPYEDQEECQRIFLSDQEEHISWKLSSRSDAWKRSS